MAKTQKKTIWQCTECGADLPKWEGRCPHCGSWNTIIETKRPTTSKTWQPAGLHAQNSKPTPISDIALGQQHRITMPSHELNRTLGGGLVAGSLVLIGGEPGIGKSTLVLQNILAIKSKRILYVSAEESPQQIKMRADRIGRGSDNCYIVCETSLENIFAHIEELHPQILIIDSIQTVATDELDSCAGSVSQVRECAARLLAWAKNSQVPVMLIGHITKEGALAGPKVLEHIVDAVLQFEGDSNYLYRILRPIKNRFGSTSELGIYEMTQKGLREITDPSQMLVSHHAEPLPGIAIGVTLEGIRPFLIEVQALVSTAAYGTPQRAVTGFDSKRLNMLLAVLEKRVGFKLGQKDVFLNIAGGLKISDPAQDLAVISAILSSNVDIPIPNGWCMAGEVGLSGEIRPVARLEQRISEAQKLGMTNMLIPRDALKGFDTTGLTLKLHPVSKVDEAFKALFG